MIPMVDLNRQYHNLKAEIDKSVLDALESCKFILGPNVTSLEEEVKSYLKAEYAISCASGTDALHLAVLAAGISEGDEVITTPFTFIATAEAICYAGATPVFVDIEPDTFNIAPHLIEKAITPKTKAVIPVHLFGATAELSKIEAICKKHNLILIEDCAQSFGAEIDGKMTGSIGDFGCFSFFPSKNLGGYGDGGLVTCKSKEAAEKIIALRNHGSKIRYHHSMIGYNSRLDDIQAAILRIKLKHIDDFNKNRRRVAHSYSEKLKDVVKTPSEPAGFGTHVYHQYTILSEKREAIMANLTAKGIASAVYYPIPLHKQDVFKDDFSAVTLPVAESVAASCMSLPVFPEMREDEIEEVVKAIKEVL